MHAVTLFGEQFNINIPQFWLVGHVNKADGLGREDSKNQRRILMVSLIDSTIL